jgi:hypothetical protein
LLLGAAIFGWLVLTLERPSIGPVSPQPWQPDGLGLLVIAYWVLVIAAGVRLAAGSRARWLGWVQASLVLVMLAPSYLAVTGSAGGGDPVFFGLAALVCAGAMLAGLLSAMALLRR